MKRLVAWMSAILVASTAHAGTITLEGSYTIETSAEQEADAPLPWNVRLNDFQQEAAPSALPQTWIVPLTAVPHVIQFGLGPFEASDITPVELGNFRLLETQLVLNYWTHTDAGGGHSLTWRMIGEEVPEPSSFALWPMALLLVRRWQ